MDSWTPSTKEDKLIYEYWCKKGGHLYLEVPIGNSSGYCNWEKGSKIRRIDAIRLPNENFKNQHNKDNIFSSKQYNTSELPNIFRSNCIELIEAKEKLNRFVIGQVIAGVDMFQRQYKPKEITQTIVCAKGDPALEWVCSKRNIKIEIVQMTN